MVEIDRLDRLVQLARQEAPPSSDEATATMRRIRSADSPRPAPGVVRWGRVATIAAAAAAAALVVVLLAGRGGRGVGEPAVPRDMADAGTRSTARAASVDMGNVAPTLDILGTLEVEVDQMMGSVAPRPQGSGRDVNNT